MFDILLSMAEMGSPSACFRVARCYEIGDGDNKNVYEAAKWYKKQLEMMMGILEPIMH